jgi:acetyl esterase/lipase
VKIVILLFFLSFFLKTDSEYIPIEYSYGSHEKQKIDLYLGNSDKVLVWIHGGGWLFGDKRAKRWVRRFHNHFTDHKELNVFMIGYRVGENTAPYAVEDVLCAYKKIEEEIELRGFSKKDIVVAGASAGGHLALFLSLSQQNISNKSCLSDLKPKAVVNLFGITEIEQTYKYLDQSKFFSLSNYVRRWIPDEKEVSEVSKQLSPLYLIDNQNIKVLTIHGTNDVWVPYSQAKLLDQQLKEKHLLHTVEGGGHYGFSEEEDQAIREKIKNFITEVHL